MKSVCGMDAELVAMIDQMNARTRDTFLALSAADRMDVLRIANSAARAKWDEVVAVQRAAESMGYDARGKVYARRRAEAIVASAAVMGIAAMLEAGKSEEGEADAVDSGGGGGGGGGVLTPREKASWVRRAVRAWIRPR